MKLATHSNPIVREKTWNEHTCIQGCVQNDRYCQEQFYRQYFPVMMALVMRYTEDRETGLTIVNNGFLKAFKNLSSFRFEGSLEGWLRRIMVHAVADYFKSTKTRFDCKNLELKDHETPYIEHGKYDYNQLLKTLNLLPPATRAVINLFFIDGYSHAQIAGILGISEGTSKWHISEGRKILAKKLNM